MDLAFSCTKGYPGQVKRHCLSFQVEAVLNYLVVPLTFAHNCTLFMRVDVQCAYVGGYAIDKPGWHINYWYHTATGQCQTASTNRHTMTVDNNSGLVGTGNLPARE